MSHNFSYTLKRTRFDEHYQPSENTRITTNFANLARGQKRQENLRNTLRMIDNRFNELAPQGNLDGHRYAVELDIISVEIDIGVTHATNALPLIEILQPHIIDKQSNECIEGIVGNNFSSYVRDYDFSVVLLDHNKGKETFSTPADFGVLHGQLFQHFVNSSTYTEAFKKAPVICLSVSSSKVYQRTENRHPVLGVEYLQNEFSPTDDYFAKMGMKVRFFMPPNSTAPLAFYFMGDLLADYTPLELIGTISTMESFQKIYRPEIYNANSSAGQYYRPSLKHEDYSLTRIVYDREERSRLAIEQGKFVEECFIKPYRSILENWSANFAA